MKEVNISRAKNGWIVITDNGLGEELTYVFNIWTELVEFLATFILPE